MADHLSKKMNIEEFAAFIFDQISRTYPDCQVAGLTPEDLNAIENLKNEKYSQWDWIYGYSPKYRYRNEINTPGKKVSFMFFVEKGKIKESTWEGDISGRLSSLLANALESRNHDYEALKPVILTLETQLKQEGLSARMLLEKII